MREQRRSDLRGHDQSDVASSSSGLTLSGQALRTINAFIEDTCVLVVIAYLLARGRTLALLFLDRLSLWESASLGMVLGLVGLTETAFPGARFPYTTHTLIVTFAVVAAGLRAGLVTAGVVAAGTLVSRPSRDAAATILAVFASVGVGEAVRRVLGTRHRLRRGFTAGLLTQSGTIAIRYTLAGQHIERLPIRTACSVVLVRVAEIDFAASRNRRVFVRAGEVEYPTRYALNRLETLLPDDQFFRVHDSCIVNLERIVDLLMLGDHNYEVRLAHGDRLPVGRSRYPELRKRLGLCEDLSS